MDKETIEQMKQKNFEVKKQILEKIKSYDKLIIGRHFRPDGDAVGSTNGLAQILKLSFPEKDINVVNEDYSDYLAFLDDDKSVFPDEYYADALFIAVDTGTVERLSNKKYCLAKEIVKIDHHVDDKPYGDIFWVEDWRSSACEMIFDFYETFKDELKIDAYAAKCLYAGINTDTGRFRFSSVNGDTLRAAAGLLDIGVDLEYIQACLDLQDYDYYKFEARVLTDMKITENGVAYIIVTREMQKEYGLTNEQASNSVSYMGSIKGCIAWIAFIENPFNDEIRVRLRSRFMPIIGIASQFRGGGHDNAAGATVYNHDEINDLLAKADEAVKTFKAENNDWM